MQLYVLNNANGSDNMTWWTYVACLRSYLIDEQQQHECQSGRHEWCIEYSTLCGSHHNSTIRRLLSDVECAPRCRYFVQYALSFSTTLIRVLSSSDYASRAQQPLRRTVYPYNHAHRVAKSDCYLLSMEFAKYLWQIYQK